MMDASETDGCIDQPLDPGQVNRITAVHNGFLYQHLYGVACLLTIVREAGGTLIVERDEDLEIRLPGEAPYIQVKLRNRPLQMSDIAGSIEQFASIRKEHSEGRREGTPHLRIITNTELGPGLKEDMAKAGWPQNIRVLSPGTEADHLPPAWTDIESAFEWCAERARRVPFGTLSPETLVWKLAALVQHAAAGRRDRRFSAESLPDLLEQLLIQLQDFPDPPRHYRPQVNEPLLVTGDRLRLITGFSGAGKTSWAAQAALHCPDPIAYLDVGGMPAASVASAIARELAARFAGGRVEGFGGALLADQSGLNVLRACARTLAAQGQRVQIILDNVHRVGAQSIRSVVEAAPELRFLCVGQPWDGAQELEAFFGITAGQLSGWSHDDIAAEFHDAGSPISVETASRIHRLTGGLPLYVQNAAALTISSYGHDATEFADAIEQRTNAERTAQEVILEATFASLDDRAKRVAAILSLSDVPLTAAEIGAFTGERGGSAAQLGAALRTLRRRSVVIGFQGNRMGLHDAMRPLARDKLAEVSEDDITAALTRLTDILIGSLQQNRDVPRLSFMMRLLPRVGRVEVLVDIATMEMFHEQGDPRTLRFELEQAADDPVSSDRDRFWAHDALSYWESRDGGQPDLARLQRMNALIAAGGLGAREQLNLKFKELAYWGTEGNRGEINRIYTEASRIAQDAQTSRLLRYNYAVALRRAGAFGNARTVLEPLIDEYFKLVGVSEQETHGKSNRKLRALIPEDKDFEDFKRLADVLNLWSHVVVDMGEPPLLRRITAMKFYGLAQAARSLVSAGTEAVDDFLTIMGDALGAREIMEQHVLPVVQESQLTDLITDIRSHYAIVLAFNGDIDEARNEIAALAEYSLGEREQAMLAERAAAIEEIAKGERRLERQAPPPGAVARIFGIEQAPNPRVGRNDPCPCGSGLKYKKCCRR